ncbi:hypothetical protein ANN_14281 [Periplaneta americana]|uniref:Uncharacterized protein n=1 Tax=Periplaneta americana TaxID=6978 RepID=A0ABQ8SVW1_PERAM|nr:hypothetical protein ANN_14281 [Periplaneta americana]
MTASETDISNSEQSARPTPDENNLLPNNSSVNGKDINVQQEDTDASYSADKIRDRKRSRNPAMWKRAQQSKQRVSGQEYETRKGKVICANMFEDKLCNCARQCNSKISSADREVHFKSFHDLGNDTKQNLFLRGCIFPHPMCKGIVLLIAQKNLDNIAFHFQFELEMTMLECVKNISAKRIKFLMEEFITAVLEKILVLLCMQEANVFQIIKFMYQML